ncbi:MAG: SMP-30/gluconolactonase/LRE family protein [Gammaproteobacteria bacterium]|nr:SMP-30/gluconolactonase/LRE family protein [Gammaproteobacteria bacterium]
MRYLTRFYCFIFAILLGACSSNGGGTGSTPTVSGPTGPTGPYNYLLYTDGTGALNYVNPRDATDTGVVKWSSDGATPFVPGAAPIARPNLRIVSNGSYSSQHYLGNLYKNTTANTLWFVNRSSTSATKPAATQLSSATNADTTGTCDATVYMDQATPANSLVIYQQTGCGAYMYTTLGATATSSAGAALKPIAGSGFGTSTGALNGVLVLSGTVINKANTAFTTTPLTFADGVTSVDLTATGSATVLANNRTGLILRVTTNGATFNLYQYDPTGTKLSAPLTLNGVTFANTLGTTRSDGTYLYFIDTTDVNKVLYRAPLDGSSTALTAMITDTTATTNNFYLTANNIITDTTGGYKSSPIATTGATSASLIILNGAASPVLSSTVTSAFWGNNQVYYQPTLSTSFNGRSLKYDGTAFTEYQTTISGFSFPASWQTGYIHKSTGKLGDDGTQPEGIILHALNSSASGGYDYPVYSTNTDSLVSTPISNTSSIYNFSSTANYGGYALAKISTASGSDIFLVDLYKGVSTTLASAVTVTATNYVFH